MSFLESYAHIANISRSSGLKSPHSVDFALLVPYNKEFSDQVRKLQNYTVLEATATYLVFGFGILAGGDVRKLVDKHFPNKFCLICASAFGGDSSPCWRWSITNTSDNLQRVPYPVPPRSQESSVYLRMTQKDSLRHLLDNSSNLREAVSTTKPRETSASHQVREISRAQTPAVTVVGTARCTTCHQVIPPGFKKETDPNRTEAEIYEACDHRFDEYGTCQLCGLPKQSTRFGLLEVD